MADPSPTVGELFKAKAVTEEQVSVAVDAYQADPATTAHPIADGYSVDLSAAVKAHIPALLILYDVHAKASDRRLATRTAILLARAHKA
ncbi:hypothetical protein [Methylorubrum extorquens]